MVVVSYSGKEINAKLVYYGPGLSGKTTNLEFVYQSIPSNSRGKMVSMKTRTERTLFFDFLPVDLGELGGFKTRFLLYTVPGQVYYNATRKLVLRGVDAIIFVADSQRGKMEENIDSLQNLRDNLDEYGLSVEEIPVILQWNKRDMPDVYTEEELNEALNKDGWPTYNAVAMTGEGVFETFRGIAKILLGKLSKDIKLDAKPARSGPAAPVKKPAATKPVAPIAPIKPVVPEAPAAAEAPVVSEEPAASPEAPGKKQPFRLGATPPVAEVPSAPTPEPAPPVSEITPAAPSSPPVESESSVPVGEVPEPEVSKTPEVEDLVAESASDPEVSGKKRKKDKKRKKSKEKAVDPLEVAYREAQKKKKEEVVYRTDTAEETSEPEEAAPQKPGFWGRLFGKKAKPVESVETQVPAEETPEVDSVPYQGETRVAAVEIPTVAGTGPANPVIIERRVQVPITLGPEEVARGARLRLVMEIRVAASEGAVKDDDISKVA